MGRPAGRGAAALGASAGLVFEMILLKGLRSIMTGFGDKMRTALLIRKSGTRKMCGQYHTPQGRASHAYCGKSLNTVG